MRIASYALLSLCLLLSSAVPAGAASAAQDTSSIMGMVTDHYGAIIAGASVTATDSEGVKKLAFTNDQGTYLISGLKPGTYDVSISAGGYKLYEVKGVVLHPDESLPVNVLLYPAPVESAPAVAVEQTTAANQSEAAPTASAGEGPAPAASAPSAQAAPHSPQVVVTSKDSGTLSGTITDQSGAVIAGATVTVSAPGGVQRSAVTNDQGNYVISGLAPGTYSVSVKAAGFGAYELKDLAVSAGASLPIDAMLQPAGAETTVEVQGQKVAQVEIETAQVSGTITEKEVVKLGLNGRNFTQLIALAPGVSKENSQDEAKVGPLGSVKYSVNGGRVEYNAFEIDGSDVLNTGLPGNTTTLMVYPSLDGIQEVKVLTSNYGAMFGRTASGTVQVTTKSGGQTFHGVAYEFLRNEFFNSRNYFDVTRHAPLYRRNDFGFTLGGPLYIPGVLNSKKQKTYFFFSEEFRIEKSPFEFNQAVPTLAQRKGDFSDLCPAGGTEFTRDQFPDCPANGLANPALGTFAPFQNNQLPVLERNAVAILGSGIIPAPNSNTGCNSSIGSCYVDTVSLPTNWRQELFRVDHDITPTLRASLRYIHDSWDTTVPLPQWPYATNSFPSIRNRFVGPGVNVVARLTQTVPPAFLNEIVLSFANSDVTLTDEGGPGVNLQRPATLDDTACVPDPNDPSPTPELQCPIGAIFNNGFGGKMPGIRIAGNNRAYGGSGFVVDPSYMPWSHTNPTYGLTDNASKVMGKHTLQFGAQVTYGQRNQTNSPIGAATADVQGLLTFSNINSPQTTGNAFADFLLHRSGNIGAIQSYTQDSRQTRYHQRYWVAEPYFQDDWRISPRLTLNLGLRLSLFGNFQEQNHNAFNWDPTAFDPALASEIKVDPNSGSLIFRGGKFLPLDLSNLDPHITNGLVRCGENGIPSGCVDSPFINPAPRVGFAWDPTGSGKTSIRGGYGVFFEHGTLNEANTGSLEGSSPLVLSMTQNFPNSWSCLGSGRAQPANAPFPCNGASAFPLNVTSIPRNTPWPYVQQWSFSLQRELPGNMVATFAYVGSKGTHLTTQRQLNQFHPVDPKANDGLFLDGNPFGPNEPLIPVLTASSGDCIGAGGDEIVLLNGTHVNSHQPAFLNLQIACFGAVRGAADPNSFREFAPTLGRIVSVENVADSQYHAFQGTVRRSAGPLTLGVSYTYSHSLDNSSDRADASFSNSFDLAANKASSSFDHRHLFNLNYVYQLPSLARLADVFKGWARDNGSGDEDQVSSPGESSGWSKRWLSGWEVSGITIFQSGTPFSVINGGGVEGISVLDNAGVANGGGAGSYPDLNPLTNAKSNIPSGGKNSRSFGPLLLNPDAFVAPRGLTFGNAGRNALNNPNRLNFDVAILKHFKFTESTGMEFRVEAFNLFNHTQFLIYDPDRGNSANNTINCYGGVNAFYSAAGGDGVDCLTGSSFLHPVKAFRPRTLQLGLKLSY